jgi:ADP-ribosylglycohydrolase
MSSTGKCFDIGKATKEALEKFEHRQEQFQHQYQIPPDDIDYLYQRHPKLLKHFNTNCSQNGVAGNGALMRLAPVPLFFYRHARYAVEFSGISGRITHGDQIAYDACRYYGALIVAALEGEKKDILLSDSFYDRHKDLFNNEELHPTIMEIVQGSYQKLDGHTGGIRGKGYIVKSLEAALWAFWSDGNSFKTGVLAAVNLGDDTDTTAAIYGQLAGAYYGYDKLPKDWREVLYAKDFIECLSRWIVYEGEQWQPQKSMAVNTVCSTSQKPSSPTVEKSAKPKPSSNAQSSYRQPDPQDQHSKPKSNATQPKPNNPAGNSQHSSHAQGGSNWDMPPEKHKSSTSPKPRQSAASKAQSTCKYFIKPFDTINFLASFFKKSMLRHIMLSFLLIAQYVYNGSLFQSIDDVCNWLNSLNDGSEKYVKHFKDRRIDADRLLNEINDKSLSDCGVNDGKARKRILEHITELKTSIELFLPEEQ